MTITVEKEDDGRFLAVVEEVPGAMAYGATAADAKTRAEKFAVEIMAEEKEKGQNIMLNSFWITFAINTMISAATADLEQPQTLANRPILKAALEGLVVAGQKVISAIQSGG